MPIRPRKSPMNSAARPRTVEAPRTADTVVNANTINAKYSAGPNASAASTISGATRVNSTVAIVPAMNDPIALVASAGPARPAFAMRLPSGAVAIAGCVQQDRRGGTAEHRAVVDPSEHDQRAGGVELHGERQKHRHRERRAHARQDADEGPHRDAEEAPKQVDRLERDAEAGEKRGERLHGSGSRDPEERSEPAAGQVHVRECDAEEKRSQRKHEADHKIAQPAAAAEAAGDTHNEHSASDHEAGRSDQDHVCEQARSHP